MNTTYWINSVMSTMFHNSRTFYVGLSSTPPNADGTGISEPIGGGYSRAMMPAFTTPANGVIHNSSAIVFPNSTNEWFQSHSMATHWVIFDGDGIDAHPLMSGRLEEAITVSIDTVVEIPAMGISISLLDG